MLRMAPQDEDREWPLRNHSLPHTLSRMSRAFTKEPDEGEAVEDLPDRPVSELPNLVTPQGLAQIEDAMVRAQDELSRAQAAADRAGIAHAGRDLRYWTARRSTAQLMHAPRGTGTVQFGSTVTIARDDGRRQTWRIVGEDEAEPNEGTLSYASPVARALMGKSVGDVVQAGSGEAEVVDIR
jgi:transcription elongation GreA/GreB family factor